MEETIEVTLTKKEVIRAIEEETNLEPGSWCVDHNHYDEHTGAPTKNDDPNCEVCAVGAVLWSGGVESYNISKVACALTAGFPNAVSFGTPKRDMNQLVKENPLAALSLVFEDTYANVGLEEAREACIKLVKDYFPAEIKIEYNGEAVYTKGAKFLRGKMKED